MIWDEVMARVVDIVRNDAALIAIHAGQFRQSGSGAQVVPGLEWMLVGDTEEELWAPQIVQFDIWTRDPAEARNSEFRLRSLFHKDLPYLLGGDFTVFSAYVDGAMLATPDRSNIMGRAVRFRFTPLRRQYALREHVSP